MEVTEKKFKRKTIELFETMTLVNGIERTRSNNK